MMPLRDAMALVIPLALGAPLPVLAQDTLRVDADGPPAWGTSVELVEELDIRGWSDATFERIAGIAIGPQGGVYIADGAVPVVQHLGPDGAWLGSVGTEGADPGEYYSVLGLRWSRRGFLAVLDPANARVTHYESGEYARSFPSSSRHFSDGRVALRWRQPALWEVFDPDGRFLGRVTLPEGTRLAAASGTTVWGVRREPDSGPMAVKFRITRN